MVLEPHTFAVVHQHFNEENQKHPLYLMEQHLKSNSIESTRMSFCVDEEGKSELLWLFFLILLCFGTAKNVL